MKKTLALFIGLFIFISAYMPLMAEDIVHTVKKGDTLWDISSEYLKTPWKWPLVWSNNNDITNPHRIFPNDRVIISRQGEKVVITIVPAQEEPQVYTPEEITREEEKSVVVSPKFSTYIYSPNILKGSGTVSKKHGIGDLASRSEQVLIESHSSLAPDQGITIVSKVSDVKKDKETIGYLYKAIAIARVEAYQSGIAKAAIDYSNQEVKAGDIVFDDLKSIEPMTVRITEPSLHSGGEIIDIYGGIMGSSDLDLVFMDVGKQDGIDQGALLSIFEETSVNKDAASFNDYRGMTLVLQSLDTSSMGLILESREPIKRGFKVVGAPE